MRQEAEPATAEIVEAAPGILCMQLPLRTPGLGHVNCYALEDGDGFTVVDPGFADPATAAALEQRLGQIGAPISRVHSVFVTHSHPASSVKPAAFVDVMGWNAVSLAMGSLYRTAEPRFKSARSRPRARGCRARTGSSRSR